MRTSSRLRVALVAAQVLILVGSTSLVPARAAEPNIPGTPLTRNVVQGVVGGQIVDEVYSVRVPAGSVLVATLRGEAGAELGLYLFDAGATSVVLDTPLAQSAKSGGSQVISVALQAGGTYFLNVNGRNVDRGYLYTLSYSYTRDTTAPVLSEINVPSPVKSSLLCAAVAARDSISGVTAIRIRDRSNPTIALWQPFSGRGTYCTAIESGEGEREIDVTVRNGVGLTTVSKYFAVLVDDTAPELTGTKPSQSGVILEPQGAVTWRFNEAVMLTSGAGSNVYVVNQLGRPVRGSTKVLPDRKRVRWKPETRISVGSMLMVAIVGVTDLAGNALPLIDTLELYRKQPARLVTKLGRVGPGTVRIRYEVSKNLLGRGLLVEVRESGSWSVFTVVTPNALIGSLRLSRGDWDAVRLRWEGDERVAANTGHALVR